MGLLSTHIIRRAGLTLRNLKQQRQYQLIFADDFRFATESGVLHGVPAAQSVTVSSKLCHI